MDVLPAAGGQEGLARKSLGFNGGGCLPRLPVSAPSNFKPDQECFPRRSHRDFAQLYSPSDHHRGELKQEEEDDHDDNDDDHDDHDDDHDDHDDDHVGNDNDDNDRQTVGIAKSTRHQSAIGSSLSLCLTVQHSLVDCTALS